MKSLGSSSKSLFAFYLSSYRPCDLAATADTVDAAANPAFIPVHRPSGDASTTSLLILAPDIASVADATAIDSINHHLGLYYQEAAIYESYRGAKIQ